MEDPMHKVMVTGVVLLGLIVFLTSLCFTNPVVAQEKEDDSPCPTPYIKIIKPKLAQQGQEIIIRGRRFGHEDKQGDVIFPPGLPGRIIYWRNNRIRVEVPLGAVTGQVLVKTDCATSNSDFLKVEGLTEEAKERVQKEVEEKEEMPEEMEDIIK
jgi:hypothetical protein